MLQRSYGTLIEAENNYYTGLHYCNGAESSWLEGTILDRAGKDITEMVRSAEEYF